ncbi:MAG: GguC protein [Sphingobacteriales bacterium]|nr:MAG: GguC protein [Sphingobacteriales bacterium]
MEQNTRLVQLRNNGKRRVALVDEPNLILLADVNSIYELASIALKSETALPALVHRLKTPELVVYDDVYHGNSEWQLLPSFDVPADPFRCLVAGTGLTHKNSALSRQMMHQLNLAEPTDSMKMYQWGVENGSPESGRIGVQPEWFYKGSGEVLRGHRDPLIVPAFANDGGEEPEIAGIYIIDAGGLPHRIGFSCSNEFSDHIMEKKNYLYLAPSKLRSCAIGPELVIDGEFVSITGTVRIYRNQELLWSTAIKTGEQNMAHSLSNLEYHHFKYSGHRIPGQGHVHFFGADAFSFGAGYRLEDADVMEVQWNGMGRALQNTVYVEKSNEKMIVVKPMHGSNQ